jgi:hypothetical protein
MSSDPDSQVEDLWKPFRFFLGEWQGSGTGQPGTGRAERKYQLILNDRFIQLSSRSIYPPQEKNPQGEIHDELGFFSYDRGRGKFIFREFHGEGFVNQYVVEKLNEGRILVMTTEAIENIPPGWRARITYEILSGDEFGETFELEKPGQDFVPFAPYITNHFKRVQSE